MSIHLSRTINVILNRIYNQNLLTTNIKKRTLKKLLKNCCTKNAPTFNNIVYEQIDAASMGLCLGPTLANIIMAELEIKVVDSLFKDGLLKFYIRYVDATLALIKESDIDNVLSKLNGFHPSLNFTVEKFDDGVAHYLELKIIDNETDIYYNNTHTGQYMRSSSYTPWNIKTAWVKALYNRATKICSNQKLLHDRKKKMFSFMSWNGSPNYVRKPLWYPLKSNSTIPSSNNSIEKNDIPESIFRLPYA